MHCSWLFDSSTTMFEGDFTIHRSPRRKRVGFRFNDSGVLEVHAPAGLSETVLRKIIDGNLPLIERARQDLSRRVPPLRREYREGELFSLWGRALPLVFSERLLLVTDEAILVPRGSPEQVRKELEKLFRRYALKLMEEKCRTTGAPWGLLPESVGITGARTRWGSCNSRKHISFCWKIVLLPEELAQYILCHELAHLRHLDHSAAFWRLTEELCPGALLKRKKLAAQAELWPLPATEE